ncbi:hypothetical protein [Paenibacillus paridis]|uniref:hypothetical protein n=1 Tax=Paenibacillus paridis TaxID=2583376 RepID=UPI00112393A7
MPGINYNLYKPTGSSIKDVYFKNVTFDEIFENHIKHTNLKEKTTRRRQNEYNLHIKPRFGHMKVKDSNIQHAINFKTSLEKKLCFT